MNNKQLFLFKLTTSILFLLFFYTANAQIKVGDNPNTIHSAAILEAESTTKGLLLPRMTTAQMNAINNPPNGLVVYNTTDSCTFFFHNSWKSFCDPENAGEWMDASANGVEMIVANQAAANGDTIAITDDGRLRLGNISSLENPNHDFLINVKKSIELAKGTGIKVSVTGDESMSYQHLRGSISQVELEGTTGNHNALTGSTSGVRISGNSTGSIGSLTGNLSYFWVDDVVSTDITNAYVVHGDFNMETSGTVTNGYGFRLNDIDNRGTITNMYGVSVGDITKGTQTNTPFSFHASDPNAYNYFAGNTGIGTESPLGKLHIQESVFANIPLIERSGQTSDALWTTLRLQASKTSALGDGFGTGLSFHVQDQTGVDNRVAIIGTQRDGSDNSGHLVFYTADNGTLSEHTRFTTDGKMGVGIPNPKGYLHTHFSNATTYETSNVGIANDFESIGLLTTNGGSTTGSTIIRIENGPINTAVTDLVSSGSYTDGFFAIRQRSSDGNMDERLRIDQAGNMGIGVNAPQERLHVDANNSYLQIDNLTGTGNVLGIDDNGKVFKTDGGGMSEWTDTLVDGRDFIYANQASSNGDSVVITDDGKIGIGNSNPIGRLDILDTVSQFGNDPEVGVVNKLFFDLGANPSSNQSITGIETKVAPVTGFTTNLDKVFLQGAINAAEHFEDGDIKGLRGATNWAYKQGGGLVGNRGLTGASNMALSYGTPGKTITIPKMIGASNQVQVYTGGTFNGTINVVDAIATQSHMGLQSAGSTITNAYGFYLNQNGVSGATITNAYGLYLDNLEGTNDYGIYQTGADDVNFFAGNIGIGTSAPTHTLEVGGASPHVSIKPSSGQSIFDMLTETGENFRILRNAANTYILSNDGGIQFGANGHGWGQFSVASNGGVGINTSNPTGKFHINNDETGTDSSFVVRNNGYVGIGMTNPAYPVHINGGDWRGIHLINDGNQGSIKYDPVGTYVADKQFLIISDETTAVDGSNGGIMFRTNNGTTGGFTADRMVIREDGNVGIGTRTPQERLHINAASDSLQIDNLAGTGTLLGIDANGKVFKTDGGGMSEWSDHTSNGVDMIIANQAAANGDSIVVTDAGKLGVGTSNPLSNLHVIDTITNVANGDAFGSRLDIKLKPNTAFTSGYHFANASEINYTIPSTATNDLTRLYTRALSINSAYEANVPTTEFHGLSTTVRSNKNATRIYGGITGAVLSDVSGTVSNVYGHNATVMLRQGVGASNVDGQNVSIQNMQGSPITNAIGVDIGVGSSQAGSLITNAYGIRINNGSEFNDLADITNQYGLYIKGQNLGTAKAYSIYSEGGTNYFGGNVGIGEENPSEIFEVDGDGQSSISVQKISSLSTSSGAGIQLKDYYDNAAHIAMNNSGILELNNNSTYLKINSSLSSGLETNSSLWVNFPGNVYTPSIALDKASGDETGFYRPDVNNIGFITDRLERMRIDESGNLGIGTNNPQHKLDVQGGKARFYQEVGIGTYVVPTEEYGLTIGVTSNTQITKGIKLNIVNATPTDGLTQGIAGQVSGNASSNETKAIDLLVIGGKANTEMSGTEYRFRTLHDGITTYGNKNQIELQSGSNTFDGTVYGIKNDIIQINGTYEGDVYAGYFNANANLTGAGKNYGVYVENGNSYFADNVGIGVEYPDEKLHIENGSLRMVDGNEGAGKVMVSDAEGTGSWADPSSINDGDWTITGNNMHSNNTGNVGVGTNDPKDKFNVNGGVLLHAYSGSNGLTVSRDNSLTGGTSPRLRVIPDGSRNFIMSENGPMRFRVGGADRMHFEENGNIGIATTTPSYKLEVNGPIRSKATISLYVNPTMADNSGDGLTAATAKKTLGAIFNLAQSMSTDYFSINISGSTSSNKVIIGEAVSRLANKTFYFGGSGYIDWDVTIGAISNTNMIFYGYPIAIEQTTLYMTSFIMGEWIIENHNTDDFIVFTLNNSRVVRYPHLGQLILRSTYGKNFFNVSGALTGCSLNQSNGPVIASQNVKIPATINSDNVNWEKKIWTKYNGNVGIGLTNPSEKLEVEGDIKIRSTNRLHFSNTSDLTYIHAPASNIMAMGTNGLERIRIDTEGKVGIGTTSPSTRLEVMGLNVASVAYEKTIAEFDGSTANYDGIFLSAPATTPTGFYGGMNFFPNTIPGSGVAQFLTHFKTADSPSAGETVHNVAIDGRLGVGTATPSQKLEVVSGTNEYVKVNPSGNFSAVSLSSQASKAYLVSNPQVNGVMSIDGQGLYSGLNLVTTAGGYNTTIGTLSPNGGGVNYLSSINGASHSHRFFHNGTEQMRIHYDGNVGIGTTTPEAKLQVSMAGTVPTSGTNGTATIATGNHFYPYGSGPRSFNIYPTTTVDGHGIGLSNGMTELYTNGRFGFFVRPNRANASGTYTSTEVLRIESNGRLGVGSTNPGDKLEVNGGLDVTSSNAAPSGGKGVTLGWYTTYGRMQTFNSKPLSINPLGNNVGIGMTDPNYKLEVNGPIMLQNASAPTASSGHAGIYTWSGELYAIDQSGNSTVISPHHFSLSPKSEEMAWSFYSKNEQLGKQVNVDMMRAIRLLESVTGEQLVYQADLNGNTIKEEQKDNKIKALEEKNKELIQKTSDLEQRIQQLEKLMLASQKQTGQE